MSAQRRWPDLPPELLADVSGRLHDAADYIRFHAVCKPWRVSLPSSAALRPSFFPWIVAQSSPCSPGTKLRCVFSKTSYRAVVPARFSRHKWVAQADGTAAWFFSASPRPTLVNPLTGDATALPPFVGHDGKSRKTKWWMEDFPGGGVLYGDGTVFLYNFDYNLLHSHWVLNDQGMETDEEAEKASIFFRAAILCPGDTAWKFLDRWFDADVEMWESEFFSSQFFAAYRVDDGKTLVGLDWNNYKDTFRLLPPPPDRDQRPSFQRKDKCERTWTIPEDEVVPTDSYLVSNHVLESRGELLRVTILIQRLGQPTTKEARAPFTVSVHALEEEVDGEARHTVRWARRDGRSFADRVMFLGLPTSFAVEVSSFHGGVDDVRGGSVYFLQQRSYGAYGQSLHGVFGYSLIDEKAKFMERLHLEEPIDLLNEAFTWLMPQPRLAPIQVIRERLELSETGAPTPKISIIRMEKPPKRFKEPFVSFNVQNLPPGVDSSRLLRFFNKYGEVSNAEVTSLGKGCVTMAMATSYETYEAEDALDGVVLDGNTLKVSEAKMKTGELCVASSVEQ